MGAKTWMIVYSHGNAKDLLKVKPALDTQASVQLAKKLFPADKLEPLENGTLSWTCPPGNELLVGCFPGVSIVAAKEFAIDHPSRLPAIFVEHGKGRTLSLHAMHSVVDWFAYALWQDGHLQRALSLSPDSGILEHIGARLPFEAPYWAGQHPVGDPQDEEDNYPFPFHPLELGEAALLDLFGYQLEGMADASQLEPEGVALMRFRRAKPWWKLW